MSDLISAVSQPALRPELDKAIIQTFELERFYNVQEQRMILPINYRDDWTRRVAEEAPMTFPAAPIVAYSAPVPADAVSPLEQARETPPVKAQALRELYEATGDLAGKRMTVPTSDALVGADPSATPEISASNGASDMRLQQVTATMLAAGEFLPLIFQYRQPGDLIPVTSKSENSGAAGVQRIEAVYKAF